MHYPDSIWFQNLDQPKSYGNRQKWPSYLQQVEKTTQTNFPSLIKRLPIVRKTTTISRNYSMLDNNTKDLITGVYYKL